MIPRLSFLGLHYIVLHIKMHIFTYESARIHTSYTKSLASCSYVQYIHSNKTDSINYIPQDTHIKPSLRHCVATIHPGNGWPTIRFWGLSVWAIYPTGNWGPKQHAWSVKPKDCDGWRDHWTISIWLMGFMLCHLSETLKTDDLLPISCCIQPFFKRLSDWFCQAWGFYRHCCCVKPALIGGPHAYHPSHLFIFSPLPVITKSASLIEHDSLSI